MHVSQQGQGAALGAGAGDRAVESVALVSAIVTVRLYLAGELVDELTFPIGVGTRDLIGDLGASHAERVAAADGSPWMVELVFPDGDHVRFGTDHAGMVEPMPVALDRIIEAIERNRRPSS